MQTKTSELEVTNGDRFGFGANWARFLEVIDNERIETAEYSLKNMLCLESLNGKTFLDVCSGSGLFSLAARRLGARVHSFDYDPQSVACTDELRRRYFPEDIHWAVEEGSVLDRDYLGKLGTFDIVYSWGVLHHTGQMWNAFGNVAPLVAPSGKLFVAIYNDQGWISNYWAAVKKAYNKNKLAKFLIFLIHSPRVFVVRIVRLLAKKGALERGMDYWRDLDDWLGGYPFEVAKPERIFGFYKEMGFNLSQMKTCGGRLGCNEFVFEKP
jgi:2-polyprenyl-3-methyl-5-hydroxy-6-metoxy-1,4-benzoquinol methylase